MLKSSELIGMCDAIYMYCDTSFDLWNIKFIELRKEFLVLNY